MGRDKTRKCLENEKKKKKNLSYPMLKSSVAAGAGPNV